VTPGPRTDDPDPGADVEHVGRSRWGRRTVTGTPRRFLSDISVATRLSLVALLVTLLSLTASAGVGLWRGATLAEGLVRDRLVSASDSRTSALELYLGSVQREVRALAASPGTSAAVTELGEGLRELAGSSTTEEQRVAVAEYYLTEVAPRFDEVRSSAIGASTLVPRSPGAVALQSLYTVPREIDDTGTTVAPELVYDARDGSAYSATHDEVHRVFSEIALRSDFDDLYLVANDGTILYSVRKRIDFATNLVLGPWSGTALSTLLDTVADAPSTDGARVSDLSAYGPAFDRPTTFVAAPVRDGGTVVGYLAVAIAVDELDAILSGEGRWDGFGESGEAFLAGPDSRMRSTSRSFAASPSAYLGRSETEGIPPLTDEQRRRMAATGTTALVQQVSSDLVRRAEAGSGAIDTTSYLGEPVLASYREVDVDGLDWVVVAQVSADELNAPVAAYVRNILFAMALFVVLVTFVVVRWSGRVTEPIRAIAARLRAVRLGAPSTAPEQRASGRSDDPDEYVVLGESIDEMLERLDERRAAVAARSEERAAIVRRFLPAAIAQRSEQAAGDVLDHVANASVVVLVVEGLGQLLHRSGADDVRQLLDSAIDEIDALALDLGLERVKVTGDRYYAVCGASRPYLDHAPRAVRFALTAGELVTELAREHGADVVVRCGVDAGRVSVGLAERTGLVYDSWGPAASGAARLAGTAPAGRVAVSTRVRHQLPEEFVVEDDDTTDSAVVLGRRETAGGVT
jgi:class 3 adenylate cyclase